MTRKGGSGRKGASARERPAPRRPRARRAGGKARVRRHPLALLAAAGVGLVAGLYLASSPRQESAALTLEVEAPKGRVRVEVLNAGGVDGLASDATEYLREVGFDVVFFGNAPTFDRDSTVVVDRVGRPDLARAVAAALGIRNVRSEPDPNLFVDVSVWLGKEWARPLGDAGALRGLGAEAAWAPRRWLERWFTDENP